MVVYRWQERPHSSYGLFCGAMTAAHIHGFLLLTIQVWVYFEYWICGNYGDREGAEPLFDREKDGVWVQVSYGGPWIFDDTLKILPQVQLPFGWFYKFVTAVLGFLNIKTYFTPRRIFDLVAFWNVINRRTFMFSDEDVADTGQKIESDIPMAFILALHLSFFGGNEYRGTAILS